MTRCAEWRCPLFRTVSARYRCAAPHFATAWTWRPLLKQRKNHHVATTQTEDRALDQYERCAWARTSLSIAYHDLEWGVPVHDDNLLFECLTLEGAQAWLSGETILKKREAYREAFAGFDPGLVATFGPARVARLLGNTGIVRNRLKIASTVSKRAGLPCGSARVRKLRCLCVALRRRGAAREPQEIAATSPSAHTTICYAFMQAVGMVNDHTIDCFRYEACRPTGRTKAARASY